MTLYHSTLLLLTCVTFLGAIPDPARSYTGVSSKVGPDTDSISLATGLTLAQATTNKTEPFVSTAPPPVSQTVKPGSEGPEVKQLQTTLKLLGYYEGAVDGVYGESTAAAVFKFQQAAGLSADGVAGPTTLDRLQGAQSQKSQPTPTTNPQASERTASAPASAKRSWLVWLLGVLAIAGAGTGVLYLLQRNSKPQKSIPASTAAPPALNTSQPAPPVATPEPAAEPLLNGTNGYSSTAVSSANTNSTHSGQPTAIPVGETTRLSRINIVDELIKELRSPDPVKRRKAIWELGQRGDTQAVQPLVDLMIDSDSKQRSLILASLSEIGVRTLKPMNRALAISLQDENPEVRKNAIRDLTRIYDLVAQISQLLRHATEDPDAEVQETARWALGQVNRIRTIANMDNIPALKNSVSPPESLPETLSENTSEP